GASITTMSESPALRSTDKSHESVWKRSLSSIIAAVSPGAGAPYSRTAEISRAMIASVFEGGSGIADLRQSRRARLVADLPATANLAQFSYAGAARPSGYCGRSSMISYHGALYATKVWAAGRTPGSSSSVASAIPYRDGALGSRSESESLH